jgi:hypothetical protein
MINQYLELSQVFSLNLELKLISEQDAKFVVDMRRDPKKSIYISETSPKLKNQVDFIKNISTNPSEKYFIVSDKARNKIGTIRIYNLGQDCFTWGSWVFRDGIPIMYAIEAALIIYKISLKYELGRALFDVRKENISVLNFHTNFGAKKLGEDNLNVFFEVTPDLIKQGLNKYSRFLPKNLSYDYFKMS